MRQRLCCRDYGRLWMFNEGENEKGKRGETDAKRCLEPQAACGTGRER